jgi:TPR repeat protein
MEREDAALDPTAIVCSACGLPQTPTRSFNKFKCPCKSTRYCNTKCQKKHWKEHRAECKRLIAELKRKKKMNKKTTTTAHEVEEETDEAEEVGERKEVEDTKMTEQNKEKEEEGDECPICLEILSKNATKFNRWTCCGKGIHGHCLKDMESMKMDGTCPFCRAKTATSYEESVKQLRPWVKKKKAWAQAHMGQSYFKGEGVKQSYEMARMLYEQAAQKGFVNAMYELGVMYDKGDGVEQSYRKAFEYYEQAAQLGDADGQFGLGLLYATGQGVTKDEPKAKKWWTASAAQGNEKAIENLKILKKQMKKN